MIHPQANYKHKDEPETAEVIHVDILRRFFKAFVHGQGMDEDDMVNWYIQALQKMERLQYGKTEE